ncbi:MAG: Hpt domain-containing protein, partial [Longimicrobiales bacterium]
MRPAEPAGTQASTSPALTSDAAREVFPAFVEESLDCLAQAESALLALEADASAAEPVNVALRAFHTIKGSAAFLGLDAISSLAHDAESLLIPVRDDGAAFRNEHADALLKAADRMRALLAQARDGMDDVVSSNESAAAAPAAPGSDGAAGATARGVAARDPGVPRAAVHDAGAASRDDWTRVRTHRLDQLVDLVGEL